MSAAAATEEAAAAAAAAAEEKNTKRGVWSAEEHDKFLVGIKLFPNGPWKTIAEQIGTRSARQVQTHAQKYYEKVARRLRGLRKHRKKLVRPEHRLGDDMMRMCAVAAPDDAPRASDTTAPGASGVDTSAGDIAPGGDTVRAGEADAPAADFRAHFGIGSIGRGSLDVQLPPLKTVCCLHNLGCGQLRSCVKQDGNGGVAAAVTAPRPHTLALALSASSPPRPPRIHSLRMILEPNVR